MSNAQRLQELRIELDSTYQEMQSILDKNNLSLRHITRLPTDEYRKWDMLRIKASDLILEFSDILKSR